MILKNENINIPPKSFFTGFKWNIFGSIFYEILKVGHQFLLLKILDQSSYGLMGSIFSIIYLTIYLTDLGYVNTIPTFFNIFTKNKQNFTNIFLKKYSYPQIALMLITAATTTCLYTKSFFYSIYSPYTFIIPSIIFAESIRIALRRFLHLAFKSKNLVIIESIFAALYMLAIWTPYIFLKIPMTLNLIFIPHLIDSVIVIIFMIIMIYKLYKKLPSEKNKVKNKNLLPRILKARLFNYSININKQFYTGNFLTPFFASNFGLKDAGIFNLINHVAEAIRSILKATAIFSGNALLAFFKEKTNKAKQYAFHLINKKLNIILYPFIIFTVINYKIISCLKDLQNIPPEAFATGILFLFLTMADYFFILYEQFYIIEEQSGSLFLFKLFEFILFYTIIISNNTISPFGAIFGILIIKAISFTLIAINAYVKWKIKLTFRISYIYILIYIFISMLFNIIFKFL
ncbi:hypothetical protein GF322_00655 [Candidatus Dependentiae bacterium]|nr:hypothetical protein [Candidatus Dependentiae bacterium]